MENLFALSLMVAIVAALSVIIIVLTSIIGPKSTNAVKDLPFEMGEVPIKIMAGHIPVKFYLVALIFVVFDVELTFLFPFSLVFRELGWTVFISMILFIGMLFLTLVYAWKKGVLSWNK